MTAARPGVPRPRRAEGRVGGPGVRGRVAGHLVALNGGRIAGGDGGRRHRRIVGYLGGGGRGVSRGEKRTRGVHAARGPATPLGGRIRGRVRRVVVLMRAAAHRGQARAARRITRRMGRGVKGRARRIRGPTRGRITRPGVLNIRGVVVGRGVGGHRRGIARGVDGRGRLTPAPFRRAAGGTGVERRGALAGRLVGRRVAGCVARGVAGVNPSGEEERGVGGEGEAVAGCNTGVELGV